LIQTELILARAIQSALTLYMIMILLRWLGPWLEIDVRAGWLRWIGPLTDPLLQAIRRILPSMGPFDFAPLAALFVVWVARILLVGAFL